jgi:hypothetical protein
VNAAHTIDPVGSSKPVTRLASGIHRMEVRNLGPAEMLVLVNKV